MASGGVDPMEFSSTSGPSSLPTSTDEFDERPRFVKEKDLIKDWSCGICLQILNQPQQTICGNRVCKPCINQKFSQSTQNVLHPCPLSHDPDDEYECQVSGLRNDRSMINNDPAAQKYLQKEIVYCTYETFGCKEKVPWRKLKEHCAACPFKPIKCPNPGCTDMMRPDDVEAHINNDCKYARVMCKKCNKAIQRSKQDMHLYECEMAVAVCSKCSKPFSTKKLLLHHELSVPNCWTRPAPCPICEPSTVSRILSGNPLSSSEEIFDSKEKLKKHFEDPSKRLIHQSNLVMQLEKMSATYGLHMDQHTSKSKKFIRAKAEPLMRAIAELQMDLKTVSDKIKTSSVNPERLDAALSSFESNKRLLAENKDKCEAVQTKMNQSGFDSQDVLQTLKAQVKRLDDKVEEVDKRLLGFEHPFFSGKLKWKISDYKAKKMEAQRGRVTSIYSFPFYTSRIGYKMCCRIYLNGDGVGRGTFLSIFFVVMKGEYDEMQTWPFSKKVTFILYNQKDNSQEKSEQFTPDPESSSFQKPTNDMNVASGCPQFISQRDLEDPAKGFLADDCLFVGINVG